MSPSLPATPEQLLERLGAIFPKFSADSNDRTARTFHSILREFTVFFGIEFSSASIAQIQALGTLINEATAKPSTLENAFGTCFLEHARQIGAAPTLGPYLSPIARALLDP